MKNRNLAKILTLVLSLALLIGSVAAINVSAVEPSEIAGVSVEHGAMIKIVIAADANATVQYKWSADGEYVTAKKGDVIESDDAAVNGKTAYYTDGVAYYELAKVAYIKVNDEETTYSVLQFLYAKLYRDEIAKDGEDGAKAAACYEALLTLGTASQAYLGDNIDATPLNEYSYIYSNTPGLTVNGGKAYMAAGAATFSIAADSSLKFDGYRIIPKNGEMIEYAKNELPATITASGVVEVATYASDIMDFSTPVTEGVNLYISDGTHYTSLTTNPTLPSRYNGAFGIIVKDPQDATNDVLQIKINGGVKSNTASSALAGSCTIAPAISSSSIENGTIHIVEYDYMITASYSSNSTTAQAWRNPFCFEAFDAENKSLGLITIGNGGSDNQYHVNIRVNAGDFGENDAKKENCIQVGIGNTQKEEANGKFTLLDSHTWYRLRFIWDETTGKQYYSVSYDGGETWYQACSEQTKTAAPTAEYLALRFQSMTNCGGIMYFDNIQYTITNTLPELPANNGIK